ncbi:hypothetical protein EYR40_002146 [Pleurotus pulmonarius]|nr:hypothetical protein EYR36_011447 [Pleurotus pulmonarius]KAF4585309.1 hypothetical protein EYR40_002146 [Pleurotus pulmonarius]KAF4607649.1 hypothetical protein EYR38_001722 [Pleurotus pulmonarius]
MAQLPLDMTFLLAAWLESLAYGFFLCLFCGTMLFNFGSGHQNDVHGRVMVGISCVMFFISTWHLAMNGFRLLQGFALHSGDVGGPLTYLGNMRMWDHIMKDTLYATQEILGNAAGIYRCFILWNSDWRVIALPLLLLVGSIGALHPLQSPPIPSDIDIAPSPTVSGYTVCARYTQVDPTVTIFHPWVKSWLEAFYSIAVVQNVMTTALMAFRIWRTSAKSAQYKTENALLPVVRILIESAALQLVVEIVLLVLYARDVNAQYILLELVTPTVGITFNAITIRIKLRAMSKSANSTAFSRSDQVQTIGSVPMKRIQVDITTEMEDDSEVKQGFPRSPVHSQSEA